MDQTTVQLTSVFIAFIAMLMPLVPRPHVGGVVNSIPYQPLKPDFSLKIFPADNSKAKLEINVELDGTDLHYYSHRRYGEKPSWLNSYLVNVANRRTDIEFKRKNNHG